MSYQTITISEEQARAFTHLYYFATSPIGKNKISEFDTKEFELYMKFYVTGFSTLLKFLHNSGNRKLKILYPSTIFLDEPKTNVSEYIVAKGAGEFLCNLIPQIFPGFHCAFPRLDKSATDQNISLTPLPVADALEIILPHIITES